MKMRKIGGLTVSAVGMGCMGFSHGYGAVPNRAEAIRLIRHAHALGCNFFDTAEGYGQGDNERIVGEALAPIRGDVILATKFRVTEAEAMDEAAALRSAQAHVEASLRRLGTDHVDLYYQHRVNKGAPVEPVAYAMGVLMREGKIISWGQSQATEAAIRRAHAVTPLAAIQSEYSMMERMFESDVIPTCGALGIGFVPFSPLASGFLSGRHSATDTYTGDDVRRVITRYAPENMQANQPLLDLLHAFAAEKDATPAQISLAWMLHKAPFIVPIPGMRTQARIRENLGAADVVLTDAEYGRLEAALAGITIHGNRTDEDIARLRG